MMANPVLHRTRLRRAGDVHVRPHNMINFDLDRVMDDPGWPGLQILTRFSGVRSYLSLLEEYVPLMQDQALLRWKAANLKSGLIEDAAEFQEQLDYLGVTLEQDIAGNFYGAFAISVAAALEGSLSDLCEYIHKREGCELRVSDLREPGTVKRALLYVRTVLRSSIQVSSNDDTALRDLQNVRNSLAHANGKLSDQRPDRVRELERLAQSQTLIRIKDDTVLVLPRFLQRSLNAAESVVNQVIHVVAARYPVAPSAA